MAFVKGHKGKYHPRTYPSVKCSRCGEDRWPYGLGRIPLPDPYVCDRCRIRERGKK